MTKKEQATMDELRRELRLAKALRLTEPVETDVAIPTDYRELSKGWLYVTNGGGAIVKACSSTIHHARGQWDRTTSQNPRRLYSTALLAARAGRRELELDCARMLAETDAMIERLAAAERGIAAPEAK